MLLFVNYFGLWLDGLMIFVCRLLVFVFRADFCGLLVFGCCTCECTGLVLFFWICLICCFWLDLVVGLVFSSLLGLMLACCYCSVVCFKFGLESLFCVGCLWLLFALGLL